MFSIADRGQRSIFALGLALAAAILLISVAVHFSADLAWLCLTPWPTNDQTAAIPPAGDTKRTSFADPNGMEALLPQAWSMPGRSASAVTWAPIPRDRALTRPPLLQPPAGRPAI
jgi:hypothetical protein